MPETPTAEPETTATPEPSLADKEVTILRTLEQLSIQRARGEIETERSYAARKQAEEKAYQKAIEEVTTAYKNESQAIQARYQSVRKGILAQYQTERQAIETEEAEVRKKTAARSNSARKSAKKEHEDTRWNALAIYEGSKADAVRKFKQFEMELKTVAEELQHLQAEAEYALIECRKYLAPAPGPAVEGTAAAATGGPPAGAAPAAPPVAEAAAPAVVAETAASPPAPAPDTDADAAPAPAPAAEGSDTHPKEPTP
jgi:hypothetical protein